MNTYPLSERLRRLAGFGALYEETDGFSGTLELAAERLEAIDKRLRGSSFNMGTDIHRILHPEEG